MQIVHQLNSFELPVCNHNDFVILIVIVLDRVQTQGLGDTDGDHGAAEYHQETCIVPSVSYLQNMQ